MMRRFSRRGFLAVAGVAAVASTAMAQQDDAGQYLVAEKTQSKLLGADSPPTQHWQLRSFDQISMLRAKQGEELRFRLINKLDEDFWLHFYGVRGASASMTVFVRAGDTASDEVVFTPPDAGTFWFGPLLKAARQRELGLSGMLIVEEAAPSLDFEDLPLIIDDWKISDAGVIDTDFANLEAAAGEGRLGNWFTVNTLLKPRITVNTTKPVRLRLLNVANTRTLNVLFKNADLAVIARDGQPIKPVALGNDVLTLTPGQRVDLVITESYGEISLLIDLEQDVVEAAFITVPPEVTKALPPDFQLPANPIPVVDTTIVPRTIALLIEGGIKGGMQSAKVGSDTLDMRTMLGRGLAWAVNGVAGPSGIALFSATRGETLVLDINNRTKFEQPLHIHGHVWHQLELNGVAVEGQSWRDTAIVPAQSVAKFLFVADNSGDWAVQSLIAERSDAGLFANFKVVDMP